MTGAMGKLWLLLSALSGAAIVACAGGQKVAPAAPEPLLEVTQTLAFEGPEGLRVEAVDAEEQRAFVRFTGIDSPLTGKVLAYERVRNGDRLEYRTKWHGRDLYALVRERDGGFRAYLPGVGRALDLTYAEEASKQVDAVAIQRAHQAQRASGELEALQRFDRDAEQRATEQALAEAEQATEARCGERVPLSVAWDTVSDAQLIEYSVSGYCETVLSALARLCEQEVGKRFVREHVRAASCRLDGENRLSLADQTVQWAINFDVTNAEQRAYENLREITPAGASASLGEQMLREQTFVCADSTRKHVVLLGPKEAAHGGMAYGDGKAFARVKQPPYLPEGWFLDPRQRNEQNNDNFRGYDLRIYSHLEPNAEEKRCTLQCGKRETQLALLEGADKEAILAQATFVPSPHQREPYALARDRAGTYYYVDRGDTEQTARDFRLYRGPRGKLRPLAMKDVVSDSEGEIFSSSSGKLRLVLGKQSAQWIAGTTSNLLLLPIPENLGLIYNELGPYLSERLGVPCDDL